MPDETERACGRRTPDNSEVLLEGPPGPGLARDRSVEAGEERHLVVEVLVVERRGRDPILAEGLGGATLQELGAVANRDAVVPAHRRVQVRVRVEVDKPGREH